MEQGKKTELETKRLNCCWSSFISLPDNGESLFVTQISNLPRALRSRETSWGDRNKLARQSKVVWSSRSALGPRGNSTPSHTERRPVPSRSYVNDDCWMIVVGMLFFLLLFLSALQSGVQLVTILINVWSRRFSNPKPWLLCTRS